MEEVQVIDCPPTPEILLASLTPPSTSLLDMLDSSSSAEELDNCSGEVGDGPTESGRNSPPPKCAICLGKCRQKCYTDSCRHQFCYRCLLEWSKIKAECPLCKQVFQSIIYNKKTYDRYQEHSISIVPPPSSPNYSAQGVGSVGGGAARAPPQVYHRLDFTLSQPPRFTYSATLRVQPSQSERLQQLFLHQSGDVQRFSREFPDDSIPSRQNGPEWRRYIYHRRLHARPLPDINGRMRECSAAFYRENPAQIHRLMPWINRELVALCRNNPAQVSIIIEDFPNLLMTQDITSPAFRERVCYWGRARTAHFIHELLNFARSPYDIIGYDRSVQYDPYYNNNVVVLSSSSSSSSGSGMSASEAEDDVVRVVEPTPGPSGPLEPGGGPSGVSSRRGRTQFTIETRSSDQTVIMTGSFGGSGVSGIVSVSTSGTQQPNGAATSTSSGYPDVSRMQPLTSMVPQQPPVNRLEDGENISLSSSDSDDCRIVGALKPPHLRTPEMVSLESDSDSDVVFVTEQATNARNQAMANNTILEQLFPESLLTQELAKLEDHVFAAEYNNGASTSSGGGSAASSGMKKYYAKPRLNRPADGIGHKSIYESSESEKSQPEASIPSDSESSSHDEVKFNIRTQPPVGIRKRKATKRRQVSPSGSSSADSSDESSTSDSESTASSSGCSSSANSASSGSDSDSDFILDNSPNVTRKHPRRSKVRSSRKSSKRRRKETKPKRSKTKKRKSSSSKRSSSSRKRPKLQIAKTPPKSSSESGKGTSASCNSGPSAEVLPSTPLKATTSSSSKKRKVRSAIIKPNTAAGKPTRQQQATTSKKRRKAPICSELITSTDFSSDENQPEPAQPSTSAPVNVQQQRESLDSSTGESDSSEDSCTIASLIRAAKTDERQEKQNTSSSSCSSSSSTSNSSCSLAGGHSKPSSQVAAPVHEQPMDEEEDDGDEEEEDENNQSLASTGGEEVDVSVAQVIAVGAEIEL